MNAINFKSVLIAALLLNLCAFVTGCRHEKHASAGVGAAPSHTYTYIVRGIIEHLPAAGDASRLISIKTQAITNFMGPDDQPSPMPAMVMDYTAAKSVALTALRVHEMIEFTYRVNWVKGVNRISRILELPPDTTLNFHSAATRAANEGNDNMNPNGALRLNLRVTERFMAFMSFTVSLQSEPCP